MANSGMVTQMRPRARRGGGYSLNDFGNDVGNAISAAAPYVLPLLEVGAGESGGRLAKTKSVGRRVKRGRETHFEGLPETPKRKGRLVKGSPEAIAWGRAMREKRAKKGGLPRKRSKKGGNLLGDIKDAGSKAGDAFKSVTGVNPFDLGYQVGEKVVGPAIDKALGNKNAKMPNLSDVMEVAKPVLKEAGKKVLQTVAKKLSGGSTAGGGRSKRAEIVKKVMKEKGLKMIEASKYVKQHGLY